MKDGGPAFPTKVEACVNCGTCTTHLTPGMTLRDYFAGQALAGDFATELRTSGNIKEVSDILAKKYYLIADAMIKAREEDV